MRGCDRCHCGSIRGEDIASCAISGQDLFVWQLPSLHAYEYYWRLDTDSYLTRDISSDVFKLMQAIDCVDVYRRIRGENSCVVWDLWSTFLRRANMTLSSA
ncbi:alpha-1,2-mannosyltransferase [Trypanosoma cruzi]|nr:alpha-1,2-mannosyltransferase [Trypanosoma cruzi]